MSGPRTFEQTLAEVSRLRDEGDFDAALAAAAGGLQLWPGNSHLHILWASLAQLQDEPAHSLDDAERALRRAIALDPTSTAGPIELGHFLDAVEDDPRGAAESFAEAVARARGQLVEGLIGRARALLQLGRRDDALECLLEARQIASGISSGSQPVGELAADRGNSTAGRVDALLGEVLGGRPA